MSLFSIFHKKPDPASETPVSEMMEALGMGLHSCGKDREWFGEYQGWICLEAKFGMTFALWTSHKEGHNNTHGSAHVVYFDSTGVAVSVYTSALTMWRVYDSDEKEEAVKFIIDKIRHAYRQYLRQ
jgi:hypothetical protein